MEQQKQEPKQITYDVTLRIICKGNITPKTIIDIVNVSLNSGEYTDFIAYNITAEQTC